MPALVCSAQGCVYNNAMYCNKGDIQVGGENAKVCQDTCCESFVERKCDRATNAIGTPSMETTIGCDARCCMYNEACMCKAEHVDISGAAASHSNETECVTFRSDR